MLKKQILCYEYVLFVMYYLAPDLLMHYLISGPADQEVRSTASDLTTRL